MEVQNNKSLVAYNWSKISRENDIVLSFKGDFNQDLTNTILLLTQKRSLQGQADVVRSRIFGILVECLQNMCKHGMQGKRPEELKPGIILISKKENGFILATGNLVANSEVEALRERLNKLKALSGEEQKSLHKEILKKTELSEKSGGGLGLIYIARKSDNIDFDFKKVDDNVSFFGLEVLILTSSAN